MNIDKLIVLALLLLQWDYPGDRSRIVFEVWRSATPDMAGAALVATTPETNYHIDTSAPQGFFRVRSKDLDSGLVSDWGTTK